MIYVSDGHLVTISHLERHSQTWNWAERNISQSHYLKRMPDPRTSYELFAARVNDNLAGALVFGRPEATRCANWYGGVEDVRFGKCEVTRWQVLNLSRVWIDAAYQVNGLKYNPGCVPGFTDRRGAFRSTLASAVIHAAIHTIGYEYLKCRPPCFLDEPYKITWLLSYCDTRLHRGTIYAASGFELYRTNDNGIQTWRIQLPGLTAEQDADIRRISKFHPRSVSYRARRAQLELNGLSQ